ncbi:MFS transporter [Bradyrhizobium sp. ISRA443]|uniref:MFS transporter n=1 Tax=unclassified Bradyrhizobium TaxID=2631580 RepID=UPI002479FFE9|nr:MULTISPECIES: MFS transporter [unclassified Bradyrhizobium]WGR98605.1 MFS transporter [Bradyrhizobium sp. ISRA436]WGS05494.1 MFS transporter [Bradyrhizobium sp. ISRA437]WGS12381.1 MFS transporter [Bradyrhizobium sp. ISRA443]
MTVSVVHADTGSMRQGWLGLLWLVLLTALWIVLIYWQPIIQTSGVPTTAHQLMAHGLIAVGLWLGLEAAGLTPDQRRTTWLAVMIPDTLWFAVAWSAAINGAFRTGISPLPTLPLAIFLPVIIGAPLLLLSKRMGQVLDAMPATWLVALQLYRVFGSWALAAGLREVLPGVLAWPAGIGDVLTGLFAVPVAIAVASGTAQGRRAAIIWNMFGLADFAVAITLGIVTSPGRFQLIVPNVLSIGAGAYPDVLTPAFVVPSSILLHALSLRQLYRRIRPRAQVSHFQEDCIHEPKNQTRLTEAN